MAGAQSLVALNLLSDIAVQATAAANVTTGSLMAAASYTEGSEIPDGEDVTIADGNATITLHKEGTNGKLVVTFDPAKLTYQGMTSASVFYSVNDAEAGNGKLVIAYAAAQAISAEDILATLNFEYSSRYVDTVVNVAFEELNENVDLADSTDVVVSNALSEDNTLASLTVLEGTLSPIFAPGVTNYTVQVAHDVEQVTVNATANDEKASVVVSDTELAEDGTCIVTVTVTAESGDVRVYTITVTREEAPEGEDPSDPSDPADQVDTTALKELITEAEGLKKSDYSEKTWNALQTALKAAEEVLENDEATQAEVDKAAENLDQAIKALAPETGTNPETGDRFQGAQAVATMLFSVAALAVLIIFRKKFFLA